ncbi:hypothetical protein ESCO_002361 [Escovopsis weberi]|uniref:Stress-response A/B barrel domain-containing protein n=1 Tax=Escovopsis weberi TaxID=150374 RepID=A0A0N0RU15_ESCWE|nr:hypothetical protein ESCO_002361 [Escovopsis weberi]
MADRIHRITMFKIPEKSDQKAMMERYQLLVDTALQNDKPYILSAVIGTAEDGPLAQGFTIVSKTEFASMADMAYYDDSDPAHQSLKQFVRSIRCEGICTVYFTPSVVGGTSA